MLDRRVAPKYAWSRRWSILRSQVISAEKDVLLCSDDVSVTEYTHFAECSYRHLRATMRSSDTPTTRELAQRLLAYETPKASTAMADTPAVCRVCDKIRRPFSTLAGATGFRSLLSRSLTLTKQQSTVPGGWEIGPDGSLQGVDGQTAESGAVLIAHLIGLMITFIGESVTLGLLHDVWPDLPDAEQSLKGMSQHERTDQG